MKDLKRLLDLMFLPEETVCVSDSKFSTHSLSIPTVLSGNVTLVSPNQKVSNKTIKTSELILLALNPIQGFRKDENVTAHRSFLWEIDMGSIESQQQYMKAIGLPYTAAIYSGNKSIHFLTVLDEPIDKKIYKLLFNWATNIGTLFDKSCGNPSRSIRIPGATRPETGREQKLLELKSKVTLDDFMAWLNQHEHLRPIPREKRTLTYGKDYGSLSPWAQKQLKDGLDTSKGRNRAFFSIACDLFKSGFSEEEAVDILEMYFVEESDFKEREFLTTINSAFKYVTERE